MIPRFTVLQFSARDRGTAGFTWPPPESRSKSAAAKENLQSTRQKAELSPGRSVVMDLLVVTRSPRFRLPWNGPGTYLEQCPLWLFPRPGLSVSLHFFHATHAFPADNTEPAFRHFSPFIPSPIYLSRVSFIALLYRYISFSWLIFERRYRLFDSASRSLLFLSGKSKAWNFVSGYCEWGDRGW